MVLTLRILEKTERWNRWSGFYRPLSVFYFVICILLYVSSNAFAASSDPDWKKAVELRRDNKLDKAQKLLKKYSSPSDFKRLKSSEKIDFLRGLLELAHVLALKNDVAGSLALLNWAEARKDDFQRAISCLKYAEILLDLGEFERAGAYVKNADKIIAKHVKDESKAGFAIGQGGKTIDSEAAWRTLSDDASVLSWEIEMEDLKKKFGATYGNYVKLRRMQRMVKRSKVPRYYQEAMRIADEIIEIDPASQFAAAAGYLKGEIQASKLSEKSKPNEIMEAKKYLAKFVRQNPEGLYRGEALMLLGKISMEIEWNAKQAEKYYSKALEYFRNSREKRDLLSLYAPISDDLKKQSKATQRPTTLNKWKRTVYHDEDPLKLYNVASSPVWYIDDKEKNCVFVLGLVAFSNGKYDEAAKYWDKIEGYSPETSVIDPRLPVTVHKRLMKACRLKAMAFWPEEKSDLESKISLKFQYAEYLILLERYSEGIHFFEAIIKKTKDEKTKNIALIGVALGKSLAFEDKTHDSSLSIYKKVIAAKAIKGSPILGRAIMEYGKLHLSRSGGYKKALPILLKYIKLFQKGRYKREAEYRIACCYIDQGKINRAKNIYTKLKNGNDAYEFFLKQKIDQYKKNK
jgi:tetratricopeptide (TPR) repeat protein